MSLAITCDHCGHPVRGVVYVLRARGAEHYDTSPIVIMNVHLHWDCVPLYGRSTEKAIPETATR